MVSTFQQCSEKIHPVNTSAIYQSTQISLKTNDRWLIQKELENSHWSNFVPAISDKNDL